MSCPLLALADVACSSNSSSEDDALIGVDTPVPQSPPRESPRAGTKTKKKSKDEKSSVMKKRPSIAADDNVEEMKTQRTTACMVSRRITLQPSFPVVLMGIISAPANAEHIAFLSDDKSFIIIHPDEMAKIIPAHFEGSDVKSYDDFLHLLAVWGFEVVKDPRYPSVNVYRHPMFIKGDWEACLRIPNVSASSNYDLATAPAPSTAALMVANIDVATRSAAKLLAQSASLEQRIRATAASRIILSQITGITNPNDKSSLFENMLASRRRPELHDVLNRKAIQQSMSSTSPTRRATLPSNPELLQITSGVVHAAKAVLHEGGQELNLRSRDDSSLLNLNAMTEAFILQSNMRRMQSRPACLTRHRLSMSLSSHRRGSI